MDQIHYQQFLQRFPELAYALSNWRHKVVSFHNGLEAALIAREFVKYVHSLPPETELSYFGHRVKAVPFHIVVKSITSDDSLDSLLQEVEHQRGNGNPHFLYVLADPLQILHYEERKMNEIYGVDIAASISLWDEIKKAK